MAFIFEYLLDVLLLITNYVLIKKMLSQPIFIPKNSVEKNIDEK